LKQTNAVFFLIEELFITNYFSCNILLICL